MTDEERQLIIDYKETFDNDRGKRVLADLRRIFQFDLSVVPRGDDGHIDIYEVMRNEGRRSVIIHILKKTEKDFDEKKQESAVHNDNILKKGE
jgi:hypothetical protein